MICHWCCSEPNLTEIGSNIRRLGQDGRRQPKPILTNGPNMIEPKDKSNSSMCPIVCRVWPGRTIKAQELICSVCPHYHYRDTTRYDMAAVPTPAATSASVPHHTHQAGWCLHSTYHQAKLDYSSMRNPLISYKLKQLTDYGNYNILENFPLIIVTIQSNKEKHRKTPDLTWKTRTKCNKKDPDITAQKTWCLFRTSNLKRPINYTSATAKQEVLWTIWLDRNQAWTEAMCTIKSTTREL